MEHTFENDFNFDPSIIKKIVRRRFKPLLITIVMFVILASTVILLLPKIYMSTATILIEQQEIPQDLVRSTVTSYADQRIQVIMQRAMTYSNLSKIIKKFSLYEDLYKKEPMEKIIETMKEDIHHKMITADVVDPISGRPVEATLAFSIGYENESPKVAQLVASELSNIFIDENLKTRRNMADQTANFLSAEGELLEKRISEIETKIAIFKEANMNSLPELVDLNLKLMDRTEQELLETDRQLRILKERKIYVKAELEKTTPYSPLYAVSGERVMSPKGRLKVLKSRYLSIKSSYAPSHPDIIRIEKEIESLNESLEDNHKISEEDVNADLNKRVSELDGRKTQLLKSYSEKHPDIVNINRELDVIYDQIFTNSMKYTQAPSGGRINDSDNPVYIQLLAQLDAIETEISAEKRRNKKLNIKLNEYEKRIVESPQIEKEYSDLLRNYKTSTFKYQEINAKLMEANIARSMERESKGERFTLIEPAMIPQIPVKPNRLLFFILSVFLSLGLGAGLVWFLEKVDNSIRSSKSLMQISGMHPLVEIPFITTTEDIQIQKEHRIKFLISTGVIVVLCLLMINFLYKPLDILWYLVCRKLGLM